MNILEVKNLVKIFNKTEAVRGISFGVERGQLLAILGPSGCGKTTTLRMIAGLEVPDEGEIWIEGTRVSSGRKVSVTQKERHIGMVFQDLALWPHMTVYKNIDFGLKALGLAKAERRKKIGSVLNKVNMQRYAHEYPSKLSGGQQQLVAIARAIVTEPKLLLMDEPLSNIDVRLREGIRQEIRRIQQETEITTIYVTHDQEDAFLLANRVAVMNTGTMEHIGSPEEIYFSPKSLFVARFVGESNIIPVKVTGPDRIATPWGELICSTKGHEEKDTFLFFRPQQAKIEQGGRYTGTIIHRDLTVGGYKYCILTAGNEITLYNEYLHETGKTVKFSIKDLRVLFF